MDDLSEIEILKARIEMQQARIKELEIQSVESLERLNTVEKERNFYKDKYNMFLNQGKK